MKTIKTALLSYGMSGKVFHAPFLIGNNGFKLIGAWERSKQLINADYPNVKSYNSLDALLQDDIDLVVVNTPVETHFNYAKEALLNGKHVLVEKAFTTSANQAEQLIEIATSRNLILSVFQNRRWDSDFKSVKKILDEKLLGEIVDAEIHFDRYRPALSTKTHKETDNLGAGILHDLGSHIIDQALQLFGFPISLFAAIRITRENSVVNDWFDITLFYKNKIVRLKASYFVREALPAYIINGMLGSFVKNRADNQEDQLKLGGNPQSSDWGTELESDFGVLNTEIDGKQVRKTVASLAGNYTEFFTDLHKSINLKTEPPVTAIEGWEVMRIIDAVIESNKMDKKIFF